MATGANIQPGRGIEVSNITPQVDLRGGGDIQTWDRIRAIGARFEEANKPNLIRRAQQRGLEIGAEAAKTGEYNPGFAFGDVGQARVQAAQAGYQAAIRTDIDRRESELRVQYRMDPQGYEQASKEMISGFINGAPPEFAVEVEAYAQDLVGRGFSAISNTRAVRDDQEAAQAMGVRVATLDERLLALAGEGKVGSPEYIKAWSEREKAQELRARNPAILYSDDQREADDERMNDGVLAASITRMAVESYRAAGGGLPGLAEGQRFLSEEILEGEAFADLSPESRQRIYRDSSSQLRDFSVADREKARAEREEEAAQRAKEREMVADLTLDITMGAGPTEAEIMAREDLSDESKNRLITRRRGYERQQRTERNRVAAVTRAAEAEVYTGFSQQAAAGMLDSTELADAVSAGLISRERAATLTGRNDRALRPVVDRVLVPSRDISGGPGQRSRRDRNERAMEAEDLAVEWARANPNATPTEQIAAGREIAQAVYGQSGAGRPANQQTRDRDNDAALRAVDEDFRAGRISASERRRRRQEIMNGD